MYSEELEMLIDAATVDGELSAKKRMILYKRAQEEGVDLDEFEMILDARIAKAKKASQPAAAPAAPQSNKVGEMKKCPACGAIYVAGTAVCPECGYAFTGIGTVRSAEKLYNLLLQFNNENKVKTDDNSGDSFKSSLGKGMLKMYGMSGDGGAGDIARRKMDLIQNFPVPNNREDLIEFLTAIQPKADPTAPKKGMTGVNVPGIGLVNSLINQHENLGYAYWVLYSNCINKARVSFANDPDFQSFFAFYDSKVKLEGLGVLGKFKK